MEQLIKVDIGHLQIEGSEGLISVSDFDDYPPQYAGVFKSFQDSLMNSATPLALSLAEEQTIPHIKALAEELGSKYENILLLGIGGSALGARAVMQFLKGPFYNLENNRPRIFILDNLDPVLIQRLDNLLDLSKTALIYTSKSGSTPETAACFLHFYHKYKEAGADPKDIVIVCDPGDNGINHIAQNLECRLLHIPKGLPGRFSVLSSVGFLPAELAGIDSQELINGARAVSKAILEQPLQQNTLFNLGVTLYELACRGKSIHVLFNYSSLLFEFGLWFMQLWAESIGKKSSLDGSVVNAGTTPLACVGATDQHSLLQLFKEGPPDKVLGFIKIDLGPEESVLKDEFPAEKEYAYFSGHTINQQLHIEQMATEMSLVKAGHPCYLITLANGSAASLGALFYFYEALTVFTANLYNVNPFDQPGVEEGKNITYALMGRSDYADRRAEYEEAVKTYDAERRIFGI